MAGTDRAHWDERYRSMEVVDREPALPSSFVPFADIFLEADTALEIACGMGQASVWLAEHGVQVQGYDVSPIAIRAANEVAESRDVFDRCTFGVADFDDGLPSGPAVDLVLCHMFRDASLDQALTERLRPGGVLAVAALSEVGAEPGRFRVEKGELTNSFAVLEPIASAEADGVAWLVARKPATS